MQIEAVKTVQVSKVIIRLLIAAVLDLYLKILQDCVVESRINPIPIPTDITRPLCLTAGLMLCMSCNV